MKPPDKMTDEELGKALLSEVDVAYNPFGAYRRGRDLVDEAAKRFAALAAIEASVGTTADHPMKP